ncbi:enolase C-terminal domain-like protein [Microbacterium sp. NPDC058389]|uniref:enolase C-terminal domain-like protein n=1 Tax=Microbacterium sp. NPDC058389 TaxID=3346475 RepID=UPI003664E412
MTIATSYRTTDVRFVTSSRHDGAPQPPLDPAGRSTAASAAYLAIEPESADGLEGHGFVYSTGTGNHFQLAAIDAVMALIAHRDVEALLADMGGTWRMLMHDTRLRWLAPDTGVVQTAIGAVVNALWDLKAKRAGMPLWRLLSRLSPDEIVDLVDFRYLTDALTPMEALDILDDAVPGRAEREAFLLANGYPAYTSTPGWLGYTDDELERLCRQALDDGFTQIKIEVGVDLEHDIRRLAIARDVCGPDFPIAIDAGRRWDVDDAVRWVGALERFDLHWVSEPTSPVDVLAHAAIANAITPIPIATGERAHSRVVVKQLLQSNAIGYLQIDATRVAGINENIANLLLAARSGVPVCPHACGAGLCEAVQHLAMFDYVAVSGSMEDRAIEYTDHFHEHFVTPAVVEGGRYRAPSAPGAGTEMLAESVDAYSWLSLVALDGVA